MNFEIQVNEKTALKLRHKEDAEIVFLLVDKNREHLRPWLPWVDTTLSSLDTEKYIEMCLEKFEKKETADFGIYYEDKLVGSTGFNKIDLVNEWAEIGYWLDKDHEGRGIMTECVKAMINYGFNELGLHRVQIRCSSLNLKSEGIPKRLGFSLEGTVREDHKRNGEFSDGFIFGLLKNEWKN